MISPSSAVLGRSFHTEIWLVCFLFCAGLLGFALYLEHARGLVPCPLCISQRLMFLCVGLVSLLAVFVRRPGVRKVCVIANLVFIGAGLVFAARHLWLQSLPAEEVPLCGPGLAFLFQTLPLAEVVRALFSGDGNCAQVSWVFLGLSIPAWSMMAFIALFAACVVLWPRAR